MVYTANLENSHPLPVEPGVISVYVANPGTSTSDTAVYVPWKDCRLAYAYSACVAAGDTAASMTIDVELNAAGGTAIGTITVAAGATVGTLDEMDWTSKAAGKDLDRSDANKDAINLETTGTSATGAFMVYMYFEPEVNQ